MPPQLPLEIRPEIAAKENALKRMIVGLRFDETPHMSDIRENGPNHGSSQLLGVLYFCHFGLHANITSSNQPFLGEGVWAASLHRSW